MAKQMKQFEKWLSNSEPKLNGRPREDAWRAALEWVLIAEWNTPDELTTLIGKELLGDE